MTQKQDKRALYKKVARYSAIGLEMGFSVAIGIVIGLLVDWVLQTKPWFTLFFLICGVVAAFRPLLALMKSVDRNERKP